MRTYLPIQHFDDLKIKVQELLDRSPFIATQAKESYIKHLPNNQLEACSELLDRIIKNILECIQSSQWIQLLIHLDDFNELYNLKVRPQPSILVQLIPILHSIVCGLCQGRESNCLIPDPDTRITIATILKNILCKSKKIIPSGFQLDHLAPIQLVMAYMFPPPRKGPSFSEEDLALKLLSLFRAARRWYRADAVYDELKKLRDKDLRQYICLLGIFQNFHSSIEAATDIWDFFKSTSIIWRVNSYRMERIIFSILARLLKAKAIQEAKLDEDEFSFVIGLGLRHLRLPQPEHPHHRADKPYDPHLTEQKMISESMPGSLRSLAKILILLLKLKSDYCLSKLSMIMAALDSYFHPSNPGLWTDNLVELLSSLSLLKAKYIGNDTFSFSSDVRRRFCHLLFPASEKLCLSKRPHIVVLGASIIKRLTFIHGLEDSSAIARQVLVEATIASDSLISPFRTISYIYCLSRVSSSFLNASKHSVDNDCDSFFALLPEYVVGIDPNDHLKTLATLELFSSVLLFITVEGNLASGAPSSIYFEELIVALLEQSFAYIRSLSGTGRHDETATHGHNVSVDGLLDQAFGNFWFLLFSKLSSELWKFAFDRTVNFLLDPLNISNPIIVYKLARHCKGNNCFIALERLLEPLIGLIINATDSGMGGKETEPLPSCARLIWYLAVLSGILRQSQVASLGKLQLLKSLIIKFSTLHQPDCVKWATKAVKAFLKSMSEVYALDCQNNNVALISPSICRPSDLSFTWFGPNDSSCIAIEEITSLLQAQYGFDRPKSIIAANNLFYWWEVISSCEARASVWKSRCLDYLIELASDETYQSEIRASALNLYQRLSFHHPHSQQSSDDMKSFLHSWMTNLQYYPKQKDLPLQYHMVRCRWVQKRYKMLQWRVSTYNDFPHHYELIREFCGHPLANIRDSSVNILENLLHKQPSSLAKLITTELGGNLEGSNGEYYARSLLKFLGRVKVRRVITGNFEDGFSCLLLLVKIIKLLHDKPTILPNSNTILTMIAFRLYPLALDGGQMLRFFEDCQTILSSREGGWKIELAFLALLVILAEHTTNGEFFSHLLLLVLNNCTNDNVEIRSLAIHCGRKLLEKRRNILAPVPNLDLPTLISKLFHIVLLDIRDNANTRFRRDCADFLNMLFQTYPESMSIIRPYIKDALREANLPLYKTRGLMELIVASIQANKSLELTIKDDLDLLLVLILRCGGVDSLRLWYDAGNFISQHSQDKEPLFKLLFDLHEGLNEGALASFLRLMTGFIFTNNSQFVEIPPVLWDLALAQLYHSSDLLRNASTMLLYKHLQEEHLIKLSSTKDGLRTLLLVAELFYSAPVMSRFWTKLPILLPIIGLAAGNEDLVIQKEAQIILKLLSCTTQAPPNLLPAILDQSQLIQAMKSSLSKRHLIQFTTLLYAKTFCLLDASSVGELIGCYAQFLKDENLDVRLDGSDLLSIIFHISPEMAERKAPPTTSNLEELLYVGSPWQKHSTVMMARSLLLAFPYAIPDWMPRLLAKLASLLSERYPVAGAVQKIFSEFKRTHEEGWERYREKFTEDELDAISELSVAPSYYA